MVEGECVDLADIMKKGPGLIPTHDSHIEDRLLKRAPHLLDNCVRQKEPEDRF